MPPAVVNSPIAAQCLFMRKKKEFLKAMQARLEGQSTKDGSASASKPSCQQANHDPPFATEAKQGAALHEGKQPKQSRKRASPAEAGSADRRPKKRKKEGATQHSWADNERILTNALQEMGFEQLKQAVSDKMQDVKSLPVTLSERPSARNRQEAYLAFSLIAVERTGIALNQVTIATAYAAFRARQGLPCDDSHKNWFS